MSFFFHELIKFNTKKKHQFYKQNAQNLKFIQLQKINGDYSRFINHYPLRNYEDYRNYSLDLKNKGIKSVPTSGSTNAIKWIPYTKEFNEELSNATHPWLYDIYEKFPLVKNGKHFWSMSWLPHDLRSTHQSDDLSYFSLPERMIMKQTMAINENISLLPTIEESMLKSLQLLIDQNVTLISIWSPTFLIEMLQMIFTHRDSLLSKLKNKEKISIIKYAKELNEELTLKLFPNLVLISAWDTSTSFLFAEKLKSLFPHVHFQGKGLFATEGVVSIPYENEFLLSYCSHFYEFECVETKKIFPAFELEKGMHAKVIITSANGFKRYQLNDVVEIYGHHNSIPKIRFIGREKEVDMVGEKLNHQVFVNIIDAVEKKFRLKIFSFLGVMFPLPNYQALIEVDPTLLNNQQEVEVVNFIEACLLEHFHYRLARESHQIQKVKLVKTANPYELYVSKIQDNMQIRGNIKIEPVVLIKE